MLHPKIQYGWDELLDEPSLDTLLLSVSPQVLNSDKTARMERAVDSPTQEEWLSSSAGAGHQVFQCSRSLTGIFNQEDGSLEL